MENPREQLKTLLGIEDDTKDGVLDFILNTVHDMICNYCRRERIPKGLESLYLDMCVSLYRAEQLGEETVNGTVKGMTEGDVSISFGSAFSVSEDTAMVFLRDYKEQLNRFRKVGW